MFVGFTAELAVLFVYFTNIKLLPKTEVTCFEVHFEIPRKLVLHSLLSFQALVYRKSTECTKCLFIWWSPN